MAGCGRSNQPIDPLNAEAAASGEAAPEAEVRAGNEQPLGAAPPLGAEPSGGAAERTGRFAYDGLPRLIHERSRLSILSSLASHPGGLRFNDLKALCNLTDGNLSRQLQLLQESELLEVWKGFRNNRPQTLVRMTEAGRERFLEYIGVLENVVADAMSAARQSHAPDHAEIPDMRRIVPT